ncbi:SDR family oxidoreductase [candidate division KSB1 bacterium]|nr:SDR family oxidoreductase [candidate division KSB1 bacterium]
MDFQNQVALVTGASRGIGRAVAQQFAAHGARVIVHYHQQRQAAEATLNALPGGPHLLLQADLTENQAIAELVATAAAKMGRIQILVNNAGIYELHPITKVNYAEWQQSWRQTLQTNLLGPANLTFWMVQHMLAHGGGRIVNISSRGAFRGEPDAPAYGASKAGLNAMSQSLAQALAPQQIYIYVVAPGFVETEMAAPFLSGPQGAAIRNQSPLGRVARPEEVARTVLFLAAEGAEFLTGSIVDVNGASYLRS